MEVRALFSHRPFWAHRFGTAPVLPTSRAEMDLLGWDSCDVILVTGDAYIDHPSFGMALIGRLLERHGFRVGILDQPAMQDPEAFRALGRPNLFWGVTAGNMDSMVNRYTSDKKVRSDDAYTPDGKAGARPDRAVTAYAQRCRDAHADVPLVIGGIEASLRRIAHYDYWSDKVRRSILVDTRADMLLYGNAERAIVELAHRLAQRQPIEKITDLRGTAHLHGRPIDFIEIDSTTLDAPGRVDPKPDPYAMEPERAAAACNTGEAAPAPLIQLKRKAPDRARTVIRMPSYEAVSQDPALYAHASRILHLESNPGNARALLQRHGKHDVWINPPPLPLTTAEMDELYELPFSRTPNPRHGVAKIPAYEDDQKFSVTILRVAASAAVRSARSPSTRVASSSRARRSRSSPRSSTSATRRRGSPATSPTSAARRRTCIASRASRRTSSARAASRRACIPTSATTSAPITRRSCSSIARHARCPA